MDERKIRTHPPIIISAVMALIFMVLAVVSISDEAKARAETAEQQEIQYATADSIEAVTTEQAVTPVIAEAETETTCESLTKSRGWGAEDSQMLMKIAMAEAEGEGVEGKALVMLVVLNRVRSDDFPGTIYEVLFQQGQFTTIAEGGRYWTTEPDEECYEALELVMSGWDESYGALYFESCNNSSWHSENLEFLFQVGNHRFYK